MIAHTLPNTAVAYASSVQIIMCLLGVLQLLLYTLLISLWVKKKSLRSFSEPKARTPGPCALSIQVCMRVLIKSANLFVLVVAVS